MALCTDAMALAPSPVAAATRFIEPEWTSPTANTAGMLEQARTGLGLRGVRRPVGDGDFLEEVTAVQPGDLAAAPS